MQYEWRESIKGPIAGFDFREIAFNAKYDIAVDKQDVTMFIKMESKVEALLDSGYRPLSEEIAKFRKTLEDVLSKTKDAHDKKTRALVEKCLLDRRFDEVAGLVEKHQGDFQKTVNVLVDNALTAFQKQLNSKEKLLWDGMTKKVAKLTGVNLASLKRTVVFKVNAPLFKHSGAQLQEKIQALVDKARKDDKSARNRQEDRDHALRAKKKKLGRVEDLLKSRDVELMKSFEQQLKKELSTENLESLRAMSKVKDAASAVAYVERFVQAGAASEVNMPSSVRRTLERAKDAYKALGKDADSQTRKAKEKELLGLIKPGSGLYSELLLNLSDTFSRWILV